VANKFSDKVMRVIRQRYGCDENSPKRDNEINMLSPKEAFEELLHWEGIYGYEDYILDIIEELFNVKLTDGGM